MLRAKGFCDLNIPANDAIKETVLKAISLGYQTIAINTYVSDKVPGKEGGSKKNKKGKGEKDSGTECLVPPPVTLKLSDLDLQRNKIVREPVILSRITISYSNPSSPFIKKYANVIQKYDIIAIIPENDNVLKQVVINKLVDVDIISLSPDTSSLQLSRHLLKAGVERDIYFELCYSPCITDILARRRIIALSHFLHRSCKSSNIIITSQAMSPKQLRYPYDVMNVGRFLGLSELAAKSALSFTPHNAVYCAMIRRNNIAKSGTEVAFVNEDGMATIFSNDDGMVTKYEGLDDPSRFVSNESGNLEQAKKKRKIVHALVNQPLNKRKKNKNKDKIDKKEKEKGKEKLCL